MGPVISEEPLFPSPGDDVAQPYTLGILGLWWSPAIGMRYLECLVLVFLVAYLCALLTTLFRNGRVYSRSSAFWPRSRG